MTGHIGPIILMDEHIRAEHDFYPSPYQLCVAALKLLPSNFEPMYVLDPGAGGGVWGKAARYALPRPAYIDGIELRNAAYDPRGYDTWTIGDFLTLDVVGKYGLVMGNPPYSMAEPFIRKSASLLLSGGYMIQLLRLAFLEGQSRGKGLWKELPPKEVRVCCQRPSFYPEGHPKAGKTDATAYMIAIFQKGWHGNTKLDWLNWR